MERKDIDYLSKRIKADTSILLVYHNDYEVEEMMIIIIVIKGEGDTTLL